MVLKLTESDIENKEILGKKLITLAEIIVRRHFYASINERDDLISEGVLKALLLIDKGDWSKQKGPFINYIYTGMRNNMHNYLYHQNKFSFADSESLIDEGKDDTYFEDEQCIIDYKLIHNICFRFTETFGEVEENVIKELINMGFIIDNLDKKSHDCSKENNSINEYGYKKMKYTNTNDITARIIGLILWQKKEKNIEQ